MRVFALACCLLWLGCSSSAVVRSAESDDPQTFRARLAKLLASEQLDLDEAQQVAEQVLEHEIAEAHGSWDRSGLDELRPCATQVEAALASRARQQDETAAQACLIRLEAGLEQPMDLAERVSSVDASWRAVGARSLVVPEPTAGSGDDETRRRLAGHGRWRRKLMADPASVVRQAAMRAAAVARDPHDAPALLEAVRLDPDPEVRKLATRAAALLDAPEVVMGLSDLWARASEDERVEIAAAWSHALPHAPEARRRLVRTAQSERGKAAVTAALALLEGQQPETSRADVVGAAAVVRNAIADGPWAPRVVAIDRAPFNWPELYEAVFAAREDPEPAVAVAALARLIAAPDQRDEVRALLRQWAKHPGDVGRRAKQTLVDAGDEKVVSLLDRDARSKSARERSAAGVSLARLGKLNRAVALMADADPRVRTAVACGIMQLPQDGP